MTKLTLSVPYKRDSAHYDFPLFISCNFFKFNRGKSYESMLGIYTGNNLCKVYIYLKNEKGKIKVKKEDLANKRTKPRIKSIIKVAKLKGEPSGTSIKERLNFSSFFVV